MDAIPFSARRHNPNSIDEYSLGLYDELHQSYLKCLKPAYSADGLRLIRGKQPGKAQKYQEKMEEVLKLGQKINQLQVDVTALSSLGCWERAQKKQEHVINLKNKVLEIGAYMDTTWWEKEMELHRPGIRKGPAGADDIEDEYCQLDFEAKIRSLQTQIGADKAEKAKLNDALNKKEEELKLLKEERDNLEGTEAARSRALFVLENEVEDLRWESAREKKKREKSEIDVDRLETARLESYGLIYPKTGKSPSPTRGGTNYDKSRYEFGSPESTRALRSAREKGYYNMKEFNDGLGLEGSGEWDRLQNRLKGGPGSGPQGEEDTTILRGSNERASGSGNVPPITGFPIEDKAIKDEEELERAANHSKKRVYVLRLESALFEESGGDEREVVHVLTDWEGRVILDMDGHPIAVKVDSEGEAVLAKEPSDSNEIFFLQPNGKRRGNLQSVLHALRLGKWMTKEEARECFRDGRMKRY